jgi:ABC-type multidrug transport system ATPase subunit
MTNDTEQVKSVVGVETPKMEETAPAGFIQQHVTAAKSRTGIDVCFTDLSYEIPVKKKDPLTIISGLSGHFSSGCLSALMGPSGSGKTTLMDIIAGRKTGVGKIQGEILYGGAQSPPNLKNLVGYVEQFDTLIGELTVEQMLMYTAELKLPKRLGRDAKQKRVDDVIEKLRLSKCRKTVIGNVLKRGISGGQAKRVNIALSLITSPTILCLDEPTSGLDSSMANEVCNLLSKLAQEGCTVLAAVHSPTSYAFSLFSDLFMLHAGGRTIYRGGVSGVKAYFESQGFKMAANVGYSLPDWLVDITTVSSTDDSDDVDTAAEVTDFAALWEKSDACSQCAKGHEELVARLKSQSQDFSLVEQRGPGQLWALRTLLAYRMTAHYKDGEFLGPRIGDKIFMGLLAMSLYWGIGDKGDVQSMQSTASALYFFMALCGYGAAAFVPSLTLERALFFRERSDGCYAPLTYYLAKFIEEAVLCIFTSLIFAVIVFWSMSLQGSFFLFVVGYFVTAMIGIALAYAVAAVAPNMEAANALLPAYVTVCMYFGGLFMLFDKIPIGWKWFSYTSFLRYTWGVVMLNQFDGQPTGELQVFVDDNGNKMNILEFYGMADDDGVMSSIGQCLGIACGQLVLFGSLGALALTFISHMKR